MVRSQSVSVTRKPDGLPADIPGGQDSGASAKAPILQDRVWTCPGKVESTN